MAKDTPDLRKQLEKFDELSAGEQLQVLRQLDTLIDDNRGEAIQLCRGTTIQLEDVSRLIKVLLSESGKPAESHMGDESEATLDHTGPRYIEIASRDDYLSALRIHDPDLYQQYCNYLKVKSVSIRDLGKLDGFHCKRIFPFSTRHKVIGDAVDVHYLHWSPDQPAAVNFHIVKKRRAGKLNCQLGITVTNLHTNEIMEFIDDGRITDLAKEKGRPLLQGSSEEYSLDPNLIATKLHALAKQNPAFGIWNPGPLIEKWERVYQRVTKSGEQATQALYDKLATPTLGQLKGGKGFVRVFEELPLENDIIRFAKSGDLLALLKRPELCTMKRYAPSAGDRSDPFWTGK